MNTSDTTNKQADYDEFFKRKAHEIVKQMCILENAFPWADINKAEKLLTIYETIKYSVDKEYKKAQGSNDAYSTEHYNTYLTLKEIEDLVKDAVQAALTVKDNEATNDIIYHTVNIDEDGVIVFPDEVIDALGWEEGDELFWDIKADGTVVVTKLEAKEEAAE